MAGEIEERFRLNFQADTLHSGSISFGRFETEALCWERRSSFSHNRYLEEVPISPSNIYAINDKLTPEAAADDYEARLKHLVESKIIPISGATGFPKFDLMLLGMGPDGHVASLFPTRLQRYETKRWVTFITDSPKPPPPRITFTFPVINSASEIAMVVTGAELADTVKKALGGGLAPGSTPLPCMEVSPEGELTWFLDKDAASKL